MAVNINVGTQRFDNSASDSFDDAADQTGQQDVSSQSQGSQQSGAGADAQTAPDPIALTHYA